MYAAALRLSPKAGFCSLFYSIDLKYAKLTTDKSAVTLKPRIIKQWFILVKVVLSVVGLFLVSMNKNSATMHQNKSIFQTSYVLALDAASV